MQILESINGGQVYSAGLMYSVANEYRCKPIVIINCVHCAEDDAQRSRSARVSTLCVLASVCTDLGSSAPRVLRSQRELCAACRGCLAWSAGDQ